MFKYAYARYGKLLLSFTVLFTVLLLAGCCTFCDEEEFCPEVEACPPVEPCDDVAGCVDCACDKDVVYAFDIPESDNDCPTGTSYATVEEDAVVDPQSGGAGVVERSGGGGVVDREGNFLDAWCQIDCPTGTPDETENPQMEWNYGASVVVASKTCN